jgi:Domain of unknown function (DUF1707)
VRASDDTRERAIAQLRGGLLDGRLGIDTFVARVERAYRAKERRELTALTSDLPKRHRLRDLVVNVLRASTGDEAPTALTPPRDGARDRYIIGRAPDCD